MKKFVLVGCALLFTNGLIAKIDTPVNNDVQIIETQQHNIIEGIGALTHRSVRLRLMEVIGHGEGPNALRPVVTRPILTRVTSFDENPTVIAHHNQITAAAQQNAD